MKTFYMEVLISGALDHDNVPETKREMFKKKLHNDLRLKWKNELREAANECGLTITEFSPITMADLIIE